MNVAIVGATGYGGIQAVNLLKKNKNYKISFLGGNKTSGLKWNDNFPFIYLDNDPYIEEISVDNISKNADFALLCLPNGLSSTLTRKLLDRGLKVIDLSADYRYESLDEWKKVYSKEAAIYKRNDDDLCKEAVYGLPEINKEEIQKFSKIADEWWDTNGKFKPLHMFNPTRIKYIKEKCIDHFKLKENNLKPLASLEILDIGCGGV